MIITKYLSIGILIFYILTAFSSNLHKFRFYNGNHSSETVSCELETLHHVTRKSIFLQNLARETYEKTNSPKIRFIAQNIMESNHAFRLKLTLVADQLNSSLPTLPFESDMQLFHKLVAGSNSQLDASLIELTKKYNDSIKDHLANLAYCNPSHATCDMLNEVFYADLFRTKGFE